MSFITINLIIEHKNSIKIANGQTWPQRPHLFWDLVEPPQKIEGVSLFFFFNIAIEKLGLAGEKVWPLRINFNCKSFHHVKCHWEFQNQKKTCGHTSAATPFWGFEVRPILIFFQTQPPQRAQTQTSHDHLGSFQGEPQSPKYLMCSKYPNDYGMLWIQRIQVSKCPMNPMYPNVAKPNMTLFFERVETQCADADGNPRAIQLTLMAIQERTSTRMHMMNSKIPCIPFSYATRRSTSTISYGTHRYRPRLKKKRVF